MRVTPLADPARTEWSHRLAWLADEDGVPVGSAFLRYSAHTDDAHRAELELTVHPAHRRAGIGTTLLDAVLDTARADGVRVLRVVTGDEAPGPDFLAARGFRRVLALTFGRLDLRTADLAPVRALAEQAHPGYRLVDWAGTVPGELAETYAASRRAMDDMPMDDADHTPEVWDVARLHAVAKIVADRGEHLHTVAALAADGSIAGFSELVTGADGDGDAQHYGTAVLPAHRGHGLGAWMKAASVVRAAAHFPKLEGLLTDTAESNTAMRAINDRFGYAPTHRLLYFERSV
ncbi:N-acetyltransferase [Actinorhabdospora filicis]|uniref:N-acetyltransferase n=1 Tax=Actinorhabdospora filicis TaxID=1785913 RepID=A0A9W6SQX7_9ACTN|nr:GNAT family N-acetyltransferase [Actinorhabdospora filicis]GLZ80237.1 N-acetyltransferase [Actinorhabdospora filicis]